MRNLRRRAAALLAVAALGIAATACDSLRDSEPFTITVAYEEEGRRLTVTPLIFTSDNSFGQIQVDNQTNIERGFAIDDLAVYEIIPARQTKVVLFDEAEDGNEYAFYDHKNPTDFRGLIRVDILSEAER